MALMRGAGAVSLGIGNRPQIAEAAGEPRGWNGAPAYDSTLDPKTIDPSTVDL